MNYSPLQTDLYQLTMAQAYRASGLAARKACFHLFFRKNPFGNAFTIACGIEQMAEYVRNYHFVDEDIAYLRSLRAHDNSQLFDNAFLDYLRAFKLDCNIDCVDEGALVFPREPLVRVRGSLIACQLLESALLNIINFQSLIATKAARMVLAAQGDAVIEFGLRRAQGFDGALSAARAAFIGGCAATSNVQAGRMFGLPVRGTMAHSFVMSYDHERDAFSDFAKAMPHNCILLVDTYRSIEGTKRAIKVAQWLKQRGQRLLAIRLDSGDIATLSKKARVLLNQAGLHDVKIFASGDLDEYQIAALKKKRAPVNIWGVGTRLVTAYDEPALGGVYKLSAIEDTDGELKKRIKLSEDTQKSTLPGVLQTRRYFDKNKFRNDVIFDEELGAPRKKGDYEDLLKPLFNDGKQVRKIASIEETQRRVRTNIEQLRSELRTLKPRKRYSVAIDRKLLLEQLKIVSRL